MIWSFIVSTLCFMLYAFFRICMYTVYYTGSPKRIRLTTSKLAKILIYISWHFLNFLKIQRVVVFNFRWNGAFSKMLIDFCVRECTLWITCVFINSIYIYMDHGKLEVLIKSPVLTLRAHFHPLNVDSSHLLLSIFFGWATFFLI